MTTTNEERITLNINAPAPTFKLRDIFNREIDLESYQGKRVLIAFFRHAGCPFCNTRVHNLEKKSEEFKARGLEMIFFFESTKELLLSSSYHESLSPVPIIADPERNWYSSYGVEKSLAKSLKSHFTTFFGALVEAKQKRLPIHWMSGKESFSSIPAEFLIDEKGFVKHLHYARGLRDRMSMEAIYDFIK